MSSEDMDFVDQAAAELAALSHVEEPVIEEVAVVESVAEVAKEPELTEVEKEAMTQGWKPKSAFEGNPDDWRPAREFKERGELFDKIHQLNRKTKQQDDALRAMTEHFAKLEETAHKRAIDTLKQKQADAAMLGDYQTVTKLTDEITQLAPPKPIAYSAPPEEVEISQDFVRRHAHILQQNTAEGKLIRDYVVNRELELKNSGDLMSYQQVVATVEREMKERFPHKFENPIKSSPAAVASPAIAPVKAKGVTFNDLPGFHKNIVRIMQKDNPNFDLQGYITLCKDSGEL